MSLNLAASIPPGATAAAETALATTPAFGYDFPNTYVGAEHNGAGGGVRITANITLNNTGTGTTALVVRCRQGSGTTGPQVGATITKPTTAGGPDVMQVSFLDTSRAAAQSGGVQYTLTMASTGLTVAGSVLTGNITVEGM